MNDVYDRLRLFGVANLSGNGESATARRLVRDGLADWGEGVMQIVTRPGVDLPEKDASACPPRAPEERYRRVPTSTIVPEPSYPLALEMVDHQTPVRIRDFHGVCGARIFTGWAVSERTPRYYASDALNAAELEQCPACGEPLKYWHADSATAMSEGGGVHRSRRSTVITAFEMERRYLAARERLCAGAPLDAEPIVCMGAELEEGLTLEEFAPLYGRDPETLRGEIAAFTADTTTTTP
jgi:hypothetical protein